MTTPPPRPHEPPSGIREGPPPDLEKQAHKDAFDRRALTSGNTEVNANSEIHYAYLTFHTALPAANTTMPSAAASPSSEPPEQPDLAAYTNPLKWPQRRKNLLLTLSCIATFLTAYTAGSYSPPANIMAETFHTTQLAVIVGITTFCSGFALAPMVLAPFSEINGRYPVFVVSGVIYVVFQAVCGVVTNLAGMLVARLLVGVGGSVFSTMVGGVIADMWEADGRNTPMAIFSGSVLVGTGAGPLVAAVITQRLDHGDAWKWVFWHQVIAGGVLMIALVVLFQESRGSVVLSRRAKAINRWYERLEQAGYYGVWVDEDDAAGGGTPQELDDSEATLRGGVVGLDGGAVREIEEAPAPGSAAAAAIDEDDEKKAGTGAMLSRAPSTVNRVALRRMRWVVKEDEQRSSLGKMISVSVYRPFHMLVTEPVVFWFSMWVAFAWAVLYLTFGSVFYVYNTVYGWDTEHAGRIFVAMMAGSAVATVVGVYQDELLRLPGWQPDCRPGSAADSPFWAFMRRRFPINVPEERLYFTCLSATLLPAGLFIFGFTARPEVTWVAPAVGIGLATIGIYSVYLATFNYLADVYHRYASSALAAQSCCRNILGGIFPLVMGFLFRNLGPARAGGLLGGIATGLTFVPWVLVFFGERIRARSKFAVELEQNTDSD